MLLWQRVSTPDHPNMVDFDKGTAPYLARHIYLTHGNKGTILYVQLLLPCPDRLRSEWRETVVSMPVGFIILVLQGWSLRDLDSLPVGVALPIREALHRCRSNPPAGASTCSL